jgi:hypothetical protein
MQIVWLHPAPADLATQALLNVHDLPQRRRIRPQCKKQSGARSLSD